MRGLLLTLLLLPCSAADEIPELSHVRKVNLERATNLPDFIADEVVIRYKSHKAIPPKWEPLDNIESEIAVRGSGGFSRRNVRLNGMPWEKPFPTFNWGVAFGDELTSLFDSKCHNAIEFEGRTEFQGKPALAYRFHAAPNGCFGYWTFKNGFLSLAKKYNPARKGRFLLDAATADLVQVEVEAVDFPRGFPNDTWKGSSAWQPVRIGDESYLLPVTFEFVIGSSTGDLFRAEVEYKNHRHFEAAANIKFQP
jgi:hypothetical protein